MSPPSFRHLVIITLIPLTLLSNGCDMKSLSHFSQESHEENQLQQQRKSSRNVQKVTAKVSGISKSDIIHASRLTSEQADALSSMVGNSKDFERQNVVVLPINLPDGFTVAEFRTWQGQSISERQKAVGYYEIVYENLQGVCFLVGGGEKLPRGEGLQKFEKISDLRSPALGAIELRLTDTDKQDGSKIITFAGAASLHVKGRNEYRFDSPFTYFLHSKGEEDFDKVRSRFKNCKMMNPRDAKTVVESLQYLNP